MVDYTINLFEQLYPDKPVPAGQRNPSNLSKSVSSFGLEFGRKRENAGHTHERLKQEAQAVIQNPDVAPGQALRPDKDQNLQYLKDN